MQRTNQHGFGIVEMVVVVLFLGVLVIAGVLLYKHNHKDTTQSYQSVVTAFVTAMGDGDTSTVNSLESPRFKNWIRASTTAQKNTKGEHGAIVTQNFYMLAKQDEELSLFNARFLAGAHVETGSYQSGIYMAPKNTTGMSETFNTKTNNYNAPSYSPSFTISVVRSGNTWLVDNVGFYASAT